MSRVQLCRVTVTGGAVATVLFELYVVARRHTYAGCAWQRDTGILTWDSTESRTVPARPRDALVHMEHCFYEAGPSHPVAIWGIPHRQSLSGCTSFCPGHYPLSGRMTGPEEGKPA